MATAETARLIASLEMQDKNFTRGLSKVERGIGRVDSKLGALSGALNRNLGRAVDTVIAKGVDALAGTIQDASDLNEEITKSQAVFGKSSAAILAWSDTTASALGISKSEALAAAGAYGNMFKTIGLNETTAADFSKRMVELAADMASFNNEDPAEMLDKLRSGLSGEAEPLRRYGVLLSEAAVKEEAYASGIAKKGKKLTEAQKVQARYNLILKQTAVQQGDVEKTGDNLAGQQRKLNALMKDASATIGTALLPAVTEVTSEFVKLLQDPATQKGLKAFANDLGKGAKALVAQLKTVDWQSFMNALGTAAGFAKDLVSAFLGMPSWVQTAVVTGWGLNKLTGGAVTSLFSGLASGLIKGVLGMNAGVVNINAAVVNGAGVPPVRGAPAGGIGAALKGIVTDFGTAVAGLGLTGAVGLTIAAIAPVALFGLTKAIIDATGKPIPVRDVEGRRTTAEARGVPVQNRPTDPNRPAPRGVMQGDWLADWMKRQKKLITGGAPGAFRPPPRVEGVGDRPSAGNPGLFKKNLDRIGFDKWVTKAQDIKNAVTTASSEQKAELSNIKNATTTLDATTKAGAVAVAATTTVQGVLQSARDAINTTVTRSGALNTQAQVRSSATGTNTTLFTVAAMITAAIWASGAANKPVVQSTNVVQKYTTVVRSGTQSDSRTYSGQ